MKLNDIQEEARNCLETALENFFKGKLKTKFKSTENIYWRSRKLPIALLIGMLVQNLFLFVRALNRPEIYARSYYNKHQFFFKAKNRFG